MEDFQEIEIDPLPFDAPGEGVVTVVDNLTTQSATSALSANQGYVLDQKIAAVPAPNGNATTLNNQAPAYYLDRENHTGNIPAANVTPDTTHRFATDTEKAAWNAKQAALGYTAENAGNKTTTLADADNTKYPTTQAVVEAIAAAVANLIASAPGALDTLNELAAALGDDPNFATTITNALATKVDKVTGKGLSANDYSTAEKNKLAGLENYDDTTITGNISTLQSGKIDKGGAVLSDISTTGLSGAFVLGRSGSTGPVAPIVLATAANASTVPYRGAAGILKVGAPVAEDDATTKQYVDTELEGKANSSDIRNTQVFEQADEPTGSTYYAGDIWIQPEA